VVVVASCFAGGEDAPRKVTLASLLEQMTDAGELARAPDPPFRAALASSHDRESVAPGSPTWFANHDSGNFVRDETREGRRERVLADVAGPGVLTRIWSANPKGTLRIYLDGDAPVVARPFVELLDGTWAPGFAREHGRGFELDFPIAFARGAKVTIESTTADELYYQVSYRTYAPGTAVEPFDASTLSRPEVQAARRALAAPPFAPPGSEVTRSIAAGDALELAAPPEGGAVTALAIAPSSPDDDALRAFLVAEFDGRETVRAPIGAFFATRSSRGAFATRTLSAASGRLATGFVMPFRRAARVRLEGATSATYEVTARVSPRPWDDRSLLFHATWTNHGAQPSRPLRDLALLDADGPGRIAGVSLDVVNHDDGWWGEGDEHVWVDGEAFPSFFGTGTEDHFGYAWCSRIPFASPNEALTFVTSSDAGPCTPSFVGAATMHRGFQLDTIPFDRHVRYELELWHWNEQATVDVQTVVYWYGR
jgi:hypothetical protein